ncbi:hypothetical protein [Endozoicomonas atrinae]|uniref:hypothetical protein n=1 Tax=Endozoicomonas atrinae TaxID=1333660 RepID=UPI000824D229|nr:hypothetical protein [Endozoicomonas atrinae]
MEAAVVNPSRVNTESTDVSRHETAQSSPPFACCCFGIRRKVTKMQKEPTAPDILLNNTPIQESPVSLCQTTVFSGILKQATPENNLPPSSPASSDKSAKLSDSSSIITSQLQFFSESPDLQGEKRLQKKEVLRKLMNMVADQSNSPAS